MSILARLLKKAETTQSKGDIPPGVVKAVNSAPRPGDSRRKYLLLGGATVVSVVLGGLVVLYVKLRVPEPPKMQRRPLPEVVAQRPVSTARQPVELVKAPVVEGESEKKITPAVRIRPARIAVAARRSAADAPAPAAPQTEKKPVAPPKDRSVVDALLFSARNAESRRDYLVAVKLYQQALEVDPHNYRIMNNLAGNMLQLGMNQEALAVVNQALSVKPDYVSAMVNAGIAQSRLGQHAAARAMLTRAVSLEPGNSAALTNLGLILEKSGSDDEARSVWRRLADNGDPQGYLGLGRLAEKRGNREEALRYYRELTALPESRQRGIKEQARDRIRAIEQNY